MIYRKITLDEKTFLEEREKILEPYKLDGNLDLSSILNFYKYLPLQKNFSSKIKEYKEKSIQGSEVAFGSSLIDEEVKNLSFFSKEKKVDFLAVSTDTFTRENKFENAQKAITESNKRNKSVLNGYPLVNYGVEEGRKLIYESDVPLQLKNISVTPRIAAEFAIAIGISSIEGGGISYNIPFSKSVSLKESIENWKYVDRLIGFYEEQGLSIHRESYPLLTSTLVPPAISNVIQILECLLAAEQGVKNISLGAAQYGNLIQDVASLKAVEEEFEKYSKLFNYKNLSISTVFYQWVGGIPTSPIESYGLISYASLVGVLSKADRIYIKNPEEHNSNYIDISLSNIIDLTKSISNTASLQKITQHIDINFEKELIKKEISQIMSKILELSNESLSEAVIKAFELGILDIPFAPSKYNLGKMMPARDMEGMLRYLDVGNLPFDEEIKNFHKKKLEERVSFENREVSFQMTVDDIFALSKGEISSKKRFNS